MGSAPLYWDEFYLVILAGGVSQAEMRPYMAIKTSENGGKLTAVPAETWLITPWRSTTGRLAALLGSGRQDGFQLRLAGHIGGSRQDAQRFFRVVKAHAVLRGDEIPA